MCCCWGGGFLYRHGVPLVQEGGCGVGRMTGLGRVPPPGTTLFFLGPTLVSAEQLSVCVGRLDRMPAMSLAIHSLMGLGMSLEPGFLKLHFNGFTLVNPSERACEREQLLMSLY